MKPKNQGALVKSFLEGAKEGAIGTLLIYKNTLYNTEGDEFMPIARRLGPEGHNLTYIINTDEHTRYHGMYSYHKTMVLGTITDLNMAQMDYITNTFIPMPTFSRPYENHPISEAVAKRVIEGNRNAISRLEDKIIDLETSTYVYSDFEKGHTDDEIIQEAQTQMNDLIRICDYLVEDLKESEVEQQLKDIEELVRVPQILEEAIADGGMDAKSLHKIIETRDRVQNTLDTIDKYMAVILAIPDESTLPGYKSEA